MRVPGPTGRAIRLAAAIAASLTLVACGVPIGDSTFEQIPTEEVSPGLATPSTTTTTTTTTTTIPDATETTVATTTIVPETLETVSIYFLSRGALRPIQLTAPAPVLPADIIGLLEDGPPESAPPNIDTAVPRGLVNDLTVSAGIVTIDLDEVVFDRIPRRDQQRAIAQMVLTFVINLPATGLALFTLDGSPTAVPRGDNLLTRDPVSRDDYLNLLDDSLVDGTVPATTTTSTSSTTTTTTTTIPSEAQPSSEPVDEGATTTAAPTTVAE